MTSSYFSQPVTNPTSTKKEKIFAEIADFTCTKNSKIVNFLLESRIAEKLF
jgi:hypothetical protein